jgi:hypothetical protein
MPRRRTRRAADAAPAVIAFKTDSSAAPVSVSELDHAVAALLLSLVEADEQTPVSAGCRDGQDDRPRTRASA